MRTTNKITPRKQRTQQLLGNTTVESARSDRTREQKTRCNRTQENVPKQDQIGKQKNKPSPRTDLEEVLVVLQEALVLEPRPERLSTAAGSGRRRQQPRRRRRRLGQDHLVGLLHGRVKSPRRTSEQPRKPADCGEKEEKARGDGTDWRKAIIIKVGGEEEEVWVEVSCACSAPPSLSLLLLRRVKGAEGTALTHEVVVVPKNPKRPMVRMRAGTQ